MQGKPPDIPSVKNLFIPVGDSLLQLSFVRRGIRGRPIEGEPMKKEDMPFVQAGLCLDLIETLQPVPVPEEESPILLRVKPISDQILKAMVTKTKLPLLHLSEKIAALATDEWTAIVQHLKPHLLMTPSVLATLADLLQSPNFSEWAIFNLDACLPDLNDVGVSSVARLLFSRTSLSKNSAYYFVFLKICPYPTGLVELLEALAYLK